MSGERPPAIASYHLARYVANQHKVPHTHFSMLSEMTINLIGPLEYHGYLLPDRMLPDISEGKMFCKWLREVKKIDPSQFPYYNHEYEDGRIVAAKLYPISLLEDFRNHFHGVWLKNQAIRYFRERDRSAVDFFPRAFPRLFQATQHRLS